MKIKEVENFEQWIIDTSKYSGCIDFNELFGRTAPVEIEIGSGKGTFLKSQAAAFPDILFVGIEWANKYYRYAVSRIARAGLTNVRLVRADAADFLRRFVPANAIHGFHLYFPDPWPKKRHHRRRFFQPDTLARMLTCLQVGGFINIATDHHDYFEHICRVLQPVLDAGAVEQIQFIRPAGAQTGETVGTNYERKYLKEGRPIYTIAVIKKTGEDAGALPEIPS